MAISSNTDKLKAMSDSSNKDKSELFLAAFTEYYGGMDPVYHGHWLASVWDHPLLENRPNSKGVTP